APRYIPGSEATPSRACRIPVEFPYRTGVTRQGKPTPRPCREFDEVMDLSLHPTDHFDAQTNLCLTAEVESCSPSPSVWGFRPWRSSTSSAPSRKPSQKKTSRSRGKQAIVWRSTPKATQI